MKGVYIFSATCLSTKQRKQEKRLGFIFLALKQINVCNFQRIPIIVRNAIGKSNFFIECADPLKPNTRKGNRRKLKTCPLVAVEHKILLKSLGGSLGVPLACHCVYTHKHTCAFQFSLLLYSYFINSCNIQL